MVYKTDQENAVKASVHDAIRKAGVSILVDDKAVLEAVPEYSAVGKSASNGKAEHAVQMLEDQVSRRAGALSDSPWKMRLRQVCRVLGTSIWLNPLNDDVP